MQTPFDPALVDYARTDLQKERLRAWLEHGSQRKAADALGCTTKAFHRSLESAKAEAARQGYAPGHFEGGTAPGYRMGKVTIQRGPGGDVERVWERQSPLDEDKIDRLRDMIDALTEGVKGASNPIPEPLGCDADLMTVIPMGDPHCGMLAWEKEVGENFDLVEFERRLTGSIDRLVEAAPVTEQCLFINLGDMFHADDSRNRTPASGHTLDVDGRYARVAMVAFRAMVYAIDRLKEKHARVIVWNRPGNHDPHSYLMLAMSLNAYYSNDERVEVPVDPSMFSFLRFGKCLFASTHGHGPKMNDLGMIMAGDRKEDWALTDHRVWFIGHFHHRKIQEDYTGCTVEIARTLAGSDAWHHAKGYRSAKDIQAIVYHREHGEIERHTCGLSMIAPSSAS
jgi:hypothetical protein